MNDGTRAACACAWLLSGCTGSSEEPSPAPPNVLLISIDTLRADALGCYGSPQAHTPCIDGFSRTALLFEAATTPAPTTLAAHTSLMTGNQPRRHGVARNGFVVHPDNRMLAEILREHGYATAAFIGSFVLSRQFGFDQGFDAFDDPFGIAAPGARPANERRAAEVADAVLRFVEKGPAGPRFLFVHFFDVHAPYSPPAPEASPPSPSHRGALADLERATLEQHQRILGRTIPSAALNQDGLPRGLAAASGLTASALDQELAQAYAAEVQYVDAQIGGLLDGLRRLGFLDRCLVVITSDHGETFIEHGDCWNHGFGVYQSTLHVPLLVQVPGQTHSARRSDPVSTLDVWPTVLYLLGIAPPAPVDGQSLIENGSGRASSGTEAGDGSKPTTPKDAIGTEPRRLFSEATKPFGCEDGVAWRNARKPKCLRQGSYKLIVWPTLELVQLFDVIADPREQRDLASSRRDVVAQLMPVLEGWASSATPLPSRYSSVDSHEVRERLEQLGYTESGEQDH